MHMQFIKAQKNLENVPTMHVMSRLKQVPNVHAVKPYRTYEDISMHKFPAYASYQAMPAW